MNALPRTRCALFCCLALIVLPALPAPGADLSAEAKGLLLKIGAGGGVCALVGAPDAAAVVILAEAGELLVYVQSADAKELAAVRKAADEAGLLGRRIFVSEDGGKRIHLAENLADAVVVADAGAAVGREKSSASSTPAARACWAGRPSSSPSQKAPTTGRTRTTARTITPSPPIGWRGRRT